MDSKPQTWENESMRHGDSKKFKKDVFGILYYDFFSIIEQAMSNPMFVER